MVVLPVYYDHISRCTPQRLGRLQATKAGPDDYDTGIA